jgi:hypothetical protein
MAYYCLTAVEGSAGGRLEAVRKYSIDPAVLRKLGELCSTRRANASRKAGTRDAIPLTRREEHWIDYALRALVLRLGQVAANESVTRLTMADLPQL